MSAHDLNARQPEWPRVRALFEQCLELGPIERAAALAGAAPEIRTEAEALLREVETDPGQLDPELGHRSLVASARQLLVDGRSIGGYEILEVLGCGGMSTVYLAEQSQPRRRVALKLLTGLQSSADAMQRFHNEGELLARLQHPGIAQIHAAGVHEEQTAVGPMRWPYLVMEYVEGSRTLAAHIAATNPGRDAILELFLQICGAMQHAHERGVVHRDLKPQNVLVDEAGTVKVIDFGIARSIAATRNPEQVTAAGDVLGTLHYMSPEQVRGDRVIDTRSDVHALGVLLFEMLTRQLPFDLASKGLPEVARILTEVDARPLRHLLPDADPDLELILAKALAKQPGERYSTAGALAEDLRRYLGNEPINARPPTLRYQLRMFARRRRGFVAAALLVLLASTIGGASSLVYAVRAHSAEDRVVAEGRVKDDALRRTFDMAIRTVLDLPRRLQDVPGATELRRTLVDEAAQQLEFVAANLPIEGEMRLQLARAHYELGMAQSGDVTDLDAIEAGEASFDRTQALLDTILAADPHDRHALHLRKDLALRRGMDAYNRRRDMETAVSCWDIVGQVIDELAALPPVPERDLRRDRANYESCLASIAIMEGDYETEIEHLERSRSWTLERRAGDAEDIDTTLALGNVGMRLGLAWERCNDLDRACAAYAEATDYLALAEDNPSNTALRQLRATVRSRYGFALAKHGRASQGEAHVRWGWKELGWLYERDPHNAHAANSYALTCSQLAEYLVRQAAQQADPVSARELYLEARTVAEKGLEVTDVLLERSREMQSLFVASVCRGIVSDCDRNLK